MRSRNCHFRRKSSFYAPWSRALTVLTLLWTVFTLRIAYLALCLQLPAAKRDIFRDFPHLEEKLIPGSYDTLQQMSICNQVSSLPRNIAMGSFPERWWKEEYVRWQKWPYMLWEYTQFDRIWSLLCNISLSVFFSIHVYFICLFWTETVYALCATLRIM